VVPKMWLERGFDMDIVHTATEPSNTRLLGLKFIYVLLLSLQFGSDPLFTRRRMKALTDTEHLFASFVLAHLHTKRTPSALIHDLGFPNQTIWIDACQALLTEAIFDAPMGTLEQLPIPNGLIRSNASKIACNPFGFNLLMLVQTAKSSAQRFWQTPATIPPLQSHDGMNLSRPRTPLHRQCPSRQTILQMCDQVRYACACQRIIRLRLTLRHMPAVRWLHSIQSIAELHITLCNTHVHFSR